jgi:Fe2+ or Zn2+ uptake regulation protein
MDAVRALPHPSAREIFDAVSVFAPLSFGTVYRNLQVLEEQGAIVRVEADPEVVRYDCRLAPHAHFRCLRCGRVFDFPAPIRVSVGKDADGFVVERRVVTLEGVCPECNQQPRSW